MKSQSKSTEALEVGVVVKPHGVRGAVRVRIHNPSSDLVDSEGLEMLWVEADGRRLEIEHVQGGAAAGAVAVLQLRGVGDRDEAEALRGARLMTSRAAVALEEDEFLYVDLVGCVVRQVPSSADGEGRAIGEVADVFEAGASDVLVIRRPDGSELMLPLVDDWVERIDPASGEILVVADAEARWQEDATSEQTTTGPDDDNRT